MKFFRRIVLSVLGMSLVSQSFAQRNVMVKVVKESASKKVDILIGKEPFTSFLYPDTLEKPVLFPLHSASGIVVTRGFPLEPVPGEPTDHPHHVGVWFNFENVNGLDFWNNSFAIPSDKKKLYGWIKTDSILEMSGGPKGVLTYHANWTNQQGQILLEERTRLEFMGTGHQRIIDRATILKADTDVLFKDAKDGLLGIRLAHELQIPSNEDEQFLDDKGNVTVIKAGEDKVASGNYITSEGKQGNDAWGTRAVWCKVYGKVGKDSVSITVIDHPLNPNYPTYWHARGYGLFAANPLGENIFTNGKRKKDLHLQKGESVTFRYRIIIDEGRKTMSSSELNLMAIEFGKSR